MRILAVIGVVFSILHISVLVSDEMYRRTATIETADKLLKENDYSKRYSTIQTGFPEEHQLLLFDVLKVIQSKEFSIDESEERALQTGKNFIQSHLSNNFHYIQKATVAELRDILKLQLKVISIATTIAKECPQIPKVKPNRFIRKNDGGVRGVLSWEAKQKLYFVGLYRIANSHLENSVLKAITTGRNAPITHPEATFEDTELVLNEWRSTGTVSDAMYNALTELTDNPPCEAIYSFYSSLLNQNSESADILVIDAVPEFVSTMSSFLPP